jgi:hypothetical protein
MYNMSYPAGILAFVTVLTSSASAAVPLDF